MTGIADRTELADIKALHEPLLPLFDRGMWAAGGLILALLLAVGLVIWLRRRRKGDGARVSARPRAIQEHWTVTVSSRLRALTQEPDNFEALRESMFELSSLVRELLGRVTEQQAVELTRREIAMRIVPLLESSLGQRTNEFFSEAELVQFARQMLPPGRFAAAVALAQEMLHLAMRREQERLDAESRRRAEGRES